MARFDQVTATFWRDSAYGVLPALTEEMIQAAERALDVTLPPLLLALLRVQNGGMVATACDAFPTTQATSWSDTHIPFDTLMGIGPHETVLNLLDTPYLVEEWGLPSPLVLLSGDGHCWVALDYRISGRHGEPSVTWFDGERINEVPLADDFHSFVEQLVPAGDFDR